MIEFIILTIPGVIAALLHCKLNNSMHLKKGILYFIPYAICINFLMLAGLWAIGMRGFSLFEMTFRFKIKWLALGIILAVILALTYKNIRNMSMAKFKDIIKRLFPTALLLVVTYAVFTPSSLFLENIDEFLFSYINIVPLILCIAIALFIALNLAALCITDEKSVTFYIALIFAASLGAYVQRNFLNPKLPTLDGTQIDWLSYTLEGRISIAFWLLCFLIIFALAMRYKEKAEKIIGYTAYFLSAVQVISLVVLIITIKLPADANHGFSKDGEFTVGSDENIVIFMLDTLQTDAIEEYIVSDVYPEGQLDDFTFFDNVVSGGAPTQLAFPVILAGMEYDPTQPEDEYKAEIWQETPFYDYLHGNGYDVRIFSSIKDFFGFKDGIAQNYGVTVKGHIGDYPEFAKQLYKFANFYLMPQFLKERFWLSTDALMDTLENSNDNYEIDNYKYYHDMLNAGEVTASYSKAFRFYHLRGVHSPYDTNENLEIVVHNSVTEQQQLYGVMTEVMMYIDEMKRLGVYDSSTIVIMGDHGRHEENNPETTPAVLIKLPYESHGLEYNSAPVHFRNFIATIAQTVMDDYSAYGPSFYDITDASDTERLHTINRGLRNRNVADDEWDDKYSSCRLIVPYEPEDLGKYQVWNPFNINRIDYKLGEVIDFTNNNDYARQINYRLYKEDNAAVASNELSICFGLSDYKKGELKLHFTYSKVYNDEQNIKIYANGSRIGAVTCTSEGVSNDTTVTIPKSKINGDSLVIRMVFPNAVTPNQLDRSNKDTRILSVGFDSIWLE